MSNDHKVLQTVYFEPEIDTRIRQYCFTNSVMKSDFVNRVVKEAFERMDRVGEYTIADQVQERAELRKNRIDDAARQIDIELALRRERIAEAIRKIDAEED